MEFIERFPHLFNFFAGYFDAYLGLTDEEIVDIFISDCLKSDVSTQDLKRIIPDLDELNNEIDLYWRDVDYASNRYFKTQEDAQAWILRIKNRLLTHQHKWQDK